MNKIKNLGILTTIGLATLFQACSDDSFKEIESGLLGNPNYDTGVYTATVSVNNINEKASQGNGLGGYLLGSYKQEPFGTKKASIVAQVVLPSVNPIFGANSQEKENSDKVQENETVTDAYLYIPFFNQNGSSDKAVYVDKAEYRLDSIYGNAKTKLNINVSVLNYFLRDIDNDLNSQVYYSNLDMKNHLGDNLANQVGYEISNKSITRYKFDDPTTSEDESKTIQDVLAPGIRIPLSIAFFQDKILNKEGGSELANLNVFKNYFRGIAISVENLSENLMMLLNMANAKIELVYSYNSKDKKISSRYEMDLKGVTVNLFNNSEESFTLENDANNIQRIFLSGGQGQTAEFKIFTDAELAELKQKDVLITDASLFLYVDNSFNYSKEPERIYIYNTKTGGILADYSHDSTSGLQLIHLGKLQKENGKGAYYQLRITNHVLNIVKNNAENVPLGIAIASDVRVINSAHYLNTSNEKKNIPMTTLATPLSTVIYGNSKSIDEGKRLKLRISYTKSK